METQKINFSCFVLKILVLRLAALPTDETGPSGSTKINIQGHSVEVTKMYKFGKNNPNVRSVINN